MENYALLHLLDCFQKTLRVRSCRVGVLIKDMEEGKELVLEHDVSKDVPVQADVEGALDRQQPKSPRN